MNSLKLVLFGVLALTLGGCGAQSTTTLYQAGAAGDGATKLTTQLLQENTINKAQAKSAYEAELGFYGSVNVCNNVVQNGSASPATIAADVQSITDEGVTLLQQLQSIQQGSVPLTTKLLLAKKARGDIATPPVYDKATGVDISTILTIAQLVADLEPAIGALFTDVLSSTSATQTQVNTELQTWNTDLSTLAALVLTPVTPS